MGERVTPPSLADTLPIDHGAAALQQLLLKLRTRASLMMIVAHPDDEDSGLLTRESRGAGARVAMLTLTRGEGGQNLMSADFGDALGLIRTQELLAADRYMGVDQLFGTEVDFGFSKTKEEAFSQWTHDRVLYDAVRAVRLYRPLVLASVFVGGPTDGHGHHQVSGEICQEVFLAAADPKVFPEMGLPPWAPLKVFARLPFSRVTQAGMFDYATGQTVPTHFHNYVTGADINHLPQATVLVHEGDVAMVNGRPALAMENLSYLQFARQGLGMQKTQIGGDVRLAPAGAFDVGYTLMGSRLGCPTGKCPPSQVPEPDLFSGIDTSLPALASLYPGAPASVAATLKSIDASLSEAEHRFDPAHLERCAPALRDSLRSLDLLIDSVSNQPAAYDLLQELRQKRVELNDALVLAHGLSLSATRLAPAAGDELLTTTTAVGVRLRLRNDGTVPLRVLTAHLIVAGRDSGADRVPELGSLEAGSTRDVELQVRSNQGLPATRPYFSRAESEQAYYDIAEPALRNAPATPDPVIVQASLDDLGVRLELAATVPAAEPHDGAVQPLVVMPPVSVELTRTVAILPTSLNAAQTVSLHARLHLRSVDAKPCPNHDVLAAGTVTGNANTSGSLSLRLPQNWTSTPPVQPFNPSCSGLSPELAFQLHPAPSRQSGAATSVQAIAQEGGIIYKDRFRSVGYPGLVQSVLYQPAVLKAVSVNVETAPHLHVGYVPGTGDAVAEFLPELGVTLTILPARGLTASMLAPYDAVVLGVRAYAAHPELAGDGSRGLLEYARAGGIVIVQYNSGVYAGDSAPYSIMVPGDSAHNVVVEADAVHILEQADPLLTWPNRIDANDFNGWVEERGHGFASSWDPHFHPLLEVHDPGQEPQRGGLLVTRTGAGAYVYVALALYRQLPEGVPGAYRLFANLLSLRQNPALRLAIQQRPASNRLEAKP